MKKRIVDSEITLIPYYPCYEEAFPWYQDLDVCKQVDNIDHVYSMGLLQGMYSYLSTHGDCYYIQYQGRLVGDVTLRDNAEVCIVVCKEYQNRHIGRRCIQSIIDLAREKQLTELKANIYSFNTQSKKMFEAIGFTQSAEEWYSYSLQYVSQDKEKRISFSE